MGLKYINKSTGMLCWCVAVSVKNQTVLQSFLFFNNLEFEQQT